MKVAIPTDDKVNISGHFGRTLGFKIYEIENSKVINSEHRTNTFTGHAQGHHQEKHHGGDHQSHGGILQNLNDCDVVIAGGMGRRLFDDFSNNNMQVFITSEPVIDKAIELFLSGTLDSNSDTCCSH